MDIEETPKSLGLLLRAFAPTEAFPPIDDVARKFCEHEGISSDADATIVWARIGVALFKIHQRSLSRRPRGRPRGAIMAKHRDLDEKIIALVEDVASERPEPPETILTRAVRMLEKRGVLESAERSTHPTRLRKKWRERHRAKRM